MDALNTAMTCLISIHAPRTGSDFGGVQWSSTRMPFQSTLPARGATSSHQGEDFRCVLISIHAPRTGSDNVRVAGNEQVVTISIHAPRTGSDCTDKRLLRHRSISIHAPRTGSDTIHPVGVGTFFTISIHAPRTGSDAVLTAHTREGYIISIHAPRTGSDPRHVADCRCVPHFNPRSPHGERLLVHQVQPPRQPISIHAPRTGSDGDIITNPPYKYAFQSTLPARGATWTAAVLAAIPFEFQSTLPARGATKWL